MLSTDFPTINPPKLSPTLKSLISHYHSFLSFFAVFYLLSSFQISNFKFQIRIFLKVIHFPTAPITKTTILYLINYLE